MWAVALGLERCRCRTLALVTAIVVGLVLATEGERRQKLGFSPAGFALVMCAACLGGVRWCLTQALFGHDRACAERRGFDLLRLAVRDFLGAGKDAASARGRRASRRRDGA